MFEIIKIKENVYLLKDQADFYATLVIGKEKALLWDTCSGLDDLRGEVRKITSLPLIVIASHGHFDHIGGVNQFECIYLDKGDFPILKLYSDELITSWLKTMNKEDKEIFFTSHNWEHIKELNFNKLDLGGIECEFIKANGHSKGSLICYIPSLKIILSGDALLPIMTLIFQNHGTIKEELETLEMVKKLDFDFYLTSHSDHKITKGTIDKMIDCLKNCKGKRFFKYKYPNPPYSEGYFYLYSNDDEPVGLIIESKDEVL